MTKKNDIKFEQPSEILILLNRYIIVIIALLIFAILIAGYWFLIRPKLNSNDQLRATTAQNASNQEASQRLLANLEKLKGAYETIQDQRQSDLEQLKKIIPTNPQIAELFVMADKLAQDNGLDLNNINIADSATEAPSVTTRVNEEGEAVAARPTATKTVGALKAMTLNFSVHRMSPETVESKFGQQPPFDPNLTDYDLFKTYIATLENNLRLMDIQSLSMPSFSASGSVNPSFSFTIVTYYR